MLIRLVTIVWSLWFVTTVTDAQTIFNATIFNATISNSSPSNNGTQWSSWYGGSGGALHQLYGTNNSSYVTTICVRDGVYINAIQVGFSDGTQSTLLGGNGSECYSVRDGECFSNVTLRHGSFVDSLEFHTSFGRVSPYWGGFGGGGPYSVSGNAYGCISKIDVRTGDFLDAIRFYFNTQATVFTSAPTAVTPTPTVQPITTQPSQMPTRLPTSAPSNIDIDNNTQWSSWYGGNGGGLHQLYGTNNSSYVTKICVREGAYIDAIQVGFSDGTQSTLLGGNGSEYAGCYSVSGNECFSNVTLRYGLFIDSLQFHTSFGRVSPYWGGFGGGGPYSVSGNAYGCISKIDVRTGDLVDAIRFYFNAIVTSDPTAEPTMNPIATMNPSVNPTMNSSYNSTQILISTSTSTSIIVGTPTSNAVPITAINILGIRIVVVMIAIMAINYKV